MMPARTMNRRERASERYLASCLRLGNLKIGSHASESVLGRRAVMVVSLLEPEEEAQLTLGGEDAAAARSGIRFRRFSIPDCGVPASRESVRELVNDIIGTLDHGRNVAVHCRQGIGRSGVIVAGVLVAAGKDVRAALGTIKESRGSMFQRPKSSDDG